MSTVCTSLATTYDSSWGKQVFSLDNLYCVLNKVTDIEQKVNLESYSSNTL